MCFVAYCFVACKAKEIDNLVVSSRDVTFSVNWKNISPYAPIPPKAKLWLYPENGNPVIIIDLHTDKQITQSLPVGNYYVIVRNDDLVTLKTRGHDKFQNHEAFLEVKPVNQYSNYFTNNSTQLLAAENQFQGAQEIIDQADMLHSLTGASPKLITVTANGNLDVAFYPQTVTSIYRVNLVVNGLEQIASGIVMLNNIATNVNFATGKISAQSDVSMQFALTQISENQFQSVATALGANPDVSGIPNTTKMQLLLQYADPNKKPLVQTVDMTNEFKDPNANLDIEIKVDPSLNSPSIKVEVKPWNDIVEDDIIVRYNK